MRDNMLVKDKDCTLFSTLVSHNILLDLGLYNLYDLLSDCPRSKTLFLYTTILWDSIFMRTDQ